MENNTPDNNPVTPVQATPVGQPVPSAGPASKTNVSAIIALILGILSLTCCGFFTGIPAILLGRSEMKASEGMAGLESNRTIAKVGMILGIIGTVLSLIGFLIYAIIFAITLATGGTLEQLMTGVQ